MFNMFSAYYKTKLKNKLKNKSQQKFSFTNSRCSLFILSWCTHSVLSPSFHDLLTMKLSLSPYLCRSHNSELSAFSVQICSFSVCPSRLLHFISGVVAASLDRRRCRFISDAAGAPSRCNHCCQRSQRRSRRRKNRRRKRKLRKKSPKKKNPRKKKKRKRKRKSKKRHWHQHRYHHRILF